MVCDCRVPIEYPVISSLRPISLTWEGDCARRYTGTTASPKAKGNILCGIQEYTITPPTRTMLVTCYDKVPWCYTSLSSSYQQRILSTLAEHILRSIERKQSLTDGSPDHPSGPSSDPNPSVPLPDIVTSSLTPAAETKPSKKHHNKHSSKRILRKFSKYNLSLLEEESR